MHKKTISVISLVLSFVFTFSLSANALKVAKPQSKATYCTITTFGDVPIETATVTFKNTSGIPLRIELVDDTNCYAVLGRTTVHKGNSKSFIIKTYLWKSGKTKIKVTPLHDGTYTYEVTGKKTNIISWSYN